MSDEIQTELEKPLLEKPKKKTKVYKEKKQESDLDIVVNNILSKKKEKGYAYKEYTDEEYQLLAESAVNIWENTLTEEERAGFDDDEHIFVLMYLTSESFVYEHTQLQALYGIETRNNNGIISVNLLHHQDLSFEERLEGGYFTPAEKNEIAIAIYPLSQSIYRKYVPGDDCFVGPYEREDITEAINLGITKALNSYVPFSDKFKISFSSWAYTCMNNACLDVIKFFNRKKNQIKVVSLDDTGAYSNGYGDDDKSDTKSQADNLSSNINDEEISKELNMESRKEFLEEVFANMLKEGNPKDVKKEILIMKLYFGFISGESETFVNIANTLNMKIDQVKKFFNSGKERLVRTVYKMGYSAEDVLEFFL